MVYAQPRIRSRKWDAVGFWDTKGSPNLDQTTRPCDCQKKKKKKKEKEKEKEKREHAE